jgi:hypothetical protein
VTIPVTSLFVQLDGIDPVLEYRLHLLFADPRMYGFKVVSGVRTYNKQLSLYSGWRKRLAKVPGYEHYNLAANPDNTFAHQEDGTFWQGSYHMVQPVTGYGHAVDLRRPKGMTVEEADNLVKKVATPLGLLQTVRSEWWHIQARSSSGYYPGPMPEEAASTMELHVPLDDLEAAKTAKTKSRLYIGSSYFETTSVRHWSGVKGVTVIADKNLPTVWAGLHHAVGTVAGSTIDEASLVDKIVAGVKSIKWSSTRLQTQSPRTWPPSSLASRLWSYSLASSFWRGMAPRFPMLFRSSVLVLPVRLVVSSSRRASFVEAWQSVMFLAWVTTKPGGVHAVDLVTT